MGNHFNAIWERNIVRSSQKYFEARGAPLHAISTKKLEKHIRARTVLLSIRLSTYLAAYGIIGKLIEDTRQRKCSDLMSGDAITILALLKEGILDAADLIDLRYADHVRNIDKPNAPGLVEDFGLGKAVTLKPHPLQNPGLELQPIATLLHSGFTLDRKLVIPIEISLRGKCSNDPRTMKFNHCGTKDPLTFEKILEIIARNGAKQLILADSPWEGHATTNETELKRHLETTSASSGWVIKSWYWLEDTKTYVAQLGPVHTIGSELVKEKIIQI